MNIRMLGTGHGECKIKRFSSKDFRRRGGVLIDGTILIDAPKDIFELEDDLGFSDLYDRVGALLISHSHPGHFDPAVISELSKKRRLYVFADKEVLKLLPPSDKIEPVAVRPFVSIEIDGYKIIPLPSNHRTENTAERCLNYIISKDKTLLYALDGALIHLDAWQIIKNTKLDAVIMDTAAELPSPPVAHLYHSDYQMNLKIKEMLVGAKLTNANTRFILSHIPSSRKAGVHEALSTLAKNDGMTVAYDGYYISI